MKYQTWRRLITTTAMPIVMPTIIKPADNQQVSNLGFDIEVTPMTVPMLVLMRLLIGRLLRTSL